MRSHDPVGGALPGPYARQVPPSTPSALLAAALSRDPARPLLTYYDDATGERTELSVATFANWVAKTANLLRDDLGVQPGALAEVDLPLHWQAAVWLQSCWELGLVVRLGPGEPGAIPRVADVAVVSHERPDDGTLLADEVVSLGLGPMGLARPGSSPTYARALDYDREVHGHGDRFVPDRTPSPDDPALATRIGTLTAGDLATAAALRPPPGSLLVTAPLTTPAAVLATGLVPLATGVTAVLCRHPDPSRLAGRVEQENLVASVGGVGDRAGGLPGWEAVFTGMA